MFSEKLIDDIVARVLEHVRSAESAAAVSTASVPSGSVKPAGGETADSGTAGNVYDEPVITESFLESRFDDGNTIDGNTLTVGRTTVLTPSAIDFLKQRNIKWVRTGHTKSQQAGKAGRQLVVLDSGPETQALIDDLQHRSDAGWQIEQHTCLSGAVAAAVEFANNPTALSFVVGQAAAVCCLANRHHGVRAAVAGDAAAAKNVIREIGANVIGVDVAGGFIQLRNMIRQLAGCTVCVPGDWPE